MGITFEKAVKGFQLSNEAEGLSPKTITWYTANLGYFLNWMKQNNEGEIQLSEITGTDIRGYLHDLRTRKSCYNKHPYREKMTRSVSPRTVLGYYTTLSSFFNWAVREELITTSPMKNIPRPKVPKFLPDPFSDEELKQMFSAAKRYEDSKGSRITAIMMVLLDTGVRMAELISIKMDDIDMDQSRIKIMGKGAKERFVFYGRNTKRALWKYISQFRAEPVAQVDNLFLTNDGRPITSRRLAHMLDEIGRKSNVKNVHPHRWRRTAAISFLRNSNGDVMTLQKMLGHETLNMVKRYLDISDEDLARVHKKASPVDNLGIPTNLRSSRRY